MNRFQKEDPTFRVGLDPDSGQTIISGMGELHLDIYVERLKREYKVEATVGKPQVGLAFLFLSFALAFFWRKSFLEEGYLCQVRPFAVLRLSF